MDFFGFLIITAFAVSIDSMVAGFAIGLKTKNVWLFATIVSVATLLLCLVATFLSIIIQDSHNLFLKKTGALFLIFVGIANFAKHQEQIPKNLCINESISLGFAVGIDAGIANLSVCLLGYSCLWIPFLFAVSHFATVSVGAKLARTKLTSKLKHTNKLSGIILFCLGIFKLLT